MKYTTREFRTNIKEALDKVDDGEEVVISRNGIDYKLIINTSSPAAVGIDKPEFVVIKFCKHGSAPQFCKFSRPGKPCNG